MPAFQQQLFIYRISVLFHLLIRFYVIVLFSVSHTLFFFLHALFSDWPFSQLFPNFISRRLSRHTFNLSFIQKIKKERLYDVLFYLSIVSRESKSKVGQGNLINPCRDRFSTVQSILQVLMFVVSDSIRHSLKGGDPAAPSDTATLLRLHPSHWFYLRRLPPCG